MVTAFISMWITNTATTAMMTPIMEAVLKQLDKHYEDINDENESEDIEVAEEKEKSTMLSGDYKATPHVALVKSSIVPIV